jgi:hypothetical protein
MSEGTEVNPVTSHYPAAAVEEALARISSQGLWLLLSFDQYGWRAEYDVIRTLLAEGERTKGGAGQHASLQALGHLFALVDKVWRLVYAIRAHRAGREFLNTESGYLTGGYKLDRKLRQLAEITPEEWRDLLDMPTEVAIQRILAEVGTPQDEIEKRTSYAAELPRLLATNMREILRFFDREDAATGPREQTASLREVDDRHRHGAPIVYLDCSPTEFAWINIQERPDEHTGETVGVVMSPPDANGAAFVPLFKHDEEMARGLRAAAEVLAGIVHRLVRAHLFVLSPGLSDPLASVTDYSVT